jgi:hypothetical protein
MRGRRKLHRHCEGRLKTPGGAGGVAVVVEIEMTRRGAGKASEGIGGAGGQGGGADALVTSTGVLEDRCCFLPSVYQVDAPHKTNFVEQTPTKCSRCSSSSEHNSKR